MRRWIVTMAVLALPLVASPADAGGKAEQGSFVARALPFPVMQPDIYYPQKGSCLGGVEGVHKVSEGFHAPAPGALGVRINDLSGDWDLYVVGTGARQLGRSEKAQVLDGAEGNEQVTVGLERHQRVKIVACNWLGEPEVTVYFDFDAKNKELGVQRRPDSDAARGRGTKRTTQRVDAAGGPVTPLWEWDPSDVEIQVGHKVLWVNDTGSDHHVTPYGGPWKNVDVMHLPTEGRIGFVFDKPGEYLYRCDFAFAGVEHSILVGDECIGMCGRVVVKKQRY